MLNKSNEKVEGFLFSPCKYTLSGNKCPCLISTKAQTPFSKHTILLYVLLNVGYDS